LKETSAFIRGEFPGGGNSDLSGKRGLSRVKNGGRERHMRNKKVLPKGLAQEKGNTGRRNVSKSQRKGKTRTKVQKNGSCWGERRKRKKKGIPGKAAPEWLGGGTRDSPIGTRRSDRGGTCRKRRKEGKNLVAGKKNRKNVKKGNSHEAEGG